MCFNRIIATGENFSLTWRNAQTNFYHLSLPMVTMNYGKTFAGGVEDIINTVISNKRMCDSDYQIIG